MSDILKLNCWVAGDEHQRGVRVNIPKSNSVSDLKEAIKTKKPQTFLDIEADSLLLWKISIPFKDFDTKLSTIQHPRDADDAVQLWPFQDLAECFTTPPTHEHIHIIVQRPADRDAPQMSETRPVLLSELLQQYQRIFIDVGKWGAFSRSDIDLNDIRDAQSGPVPDFVKIFERKLVSKPNLAPDVSSFFNLTHEWFHHHSESWDAYFDRDDSTAHAQDIPRKDLTTEDESHEDREQPWRSAGQIEASHIVDLAGIDWKCFWDGPFGKALKGHVADGIFFYKFLAHVHSLEDNDNMPVAQLGSFPWPFELVMKCATQPMDDQHRTYKPCSDLLILKSNLPRLLVEVNSTQTPEWPPDLIRMLLQGAAIVRFANGFLDAAEFVLVAFFIHPDGRVTRYTLFQGNDEVIYYRAEKFSLNKPVDRVAFARQLYNSFYMLAGEKNGDTKAKISEFKHKLSAHRKDFPMKSFLTKEGTKRKRARTDGNEDAGTGAGGSGAADHAVLRAHGYEVKPDVIRDANGIAWERLFKRPSHILTVHRSSDPSKELIAKKVREESNELEILRILDTTQPKSEHVISLLDSFHAHPGQWVILPQMDTVAAYLRIAPSKLDDSVAQICWGLINGLAYLHMHHIAHRDIKPDNLVVDTDFCLKIIDFDVAMRVKDEDDEVDDYCGTKYWIAPEVEKAPLMYSPIKADRWSCGHVILYLLDELGKEDNPLRAIARKLKVQNPKQRPSLLKWRIWGSAPLQNIPGRGKVGERKVLQPRQDTIEVDGASMKPPKAKKQRRTVFDQSEGEGFAELGELRPMVQKVY